MEPRLILTTKPNADAGLLLEILSRYGGQPDSVGVDAHGFGIGEQASLLRTGAAGLALMHPSYDDLIGFDTKLLHVAGQVSLLLAWPQHGRGIASGL